MAAVETKCVEWIGAVQSRGYGVVYRDGSHVLAHRLAYEGAHGLIPEGGQIHHACENKRCVNPEHLRLITSNAEHRALHRRELCKKGLHRMTPENSKGRRCRACYRAYMRDWYARRKVVA